MAHNHLGSFPRAPNLLILLLLYILCVYKDNIKVNICVWGIRILDKYLLLYVHVDAWCEPRRHELSAAHPLAHRITILGSASQLSIVL